jgi:hypothetical protein
MVGMAIDKDTIKVSLRDDVRVQTTTRKLTIMATSQIRLVCRLSPVHLCQELIVDPLLTAFTALTPHSAYTASDTLITPLGSLQEYHSGLSLAQRYLKFNESQRYIQGIQWPKLDLEQVDFKAEYVSGFPISNGTAEN